MELVRDTGRVAFLADDAEEWGIRPFLLCRDAAGRVVDVGMRR